MLLTDEAAGCEKRVIFVLEAGVLLATSEVLLTIVALPFIFFSYLLTDSACLSALTPFCSLVAFSIIAIFFMPDNFHFLDHYKNIQFHHSAQELQPAPN